MALEPYKGRPAAVAIKFDIALAVDIINEISRWWNGEIGGHRCVKNIVDKGVPAAVGFCASTRGYYAGSVAKITAESLIEKLTCWVFDLPQDEALEKAYNFLGVSQRASNDEIESRFRELALKYHPDKGGDPDKFIQLEYYIALIRVARKEKN